jgi:hypothetical protein
MIDNQVHANVLPTQPSNISVQPHTLAFIANESSGESPDLPYIPHGDHRTDSLTHDGLWDFQGTSVMGVCLCYNILMIDLLEQVNLIACPFQ